jgi:hypothetical protein
VNRRPDPLATGGSGIVRLFAAVFVNGALAMVVVAATTRCEEQ